MITLMRLRLPVAAAAFLIAASGAALPAMAAPPAVETSLPAVSARLDKGLLKVRFVHAVSGHTDASRSRTVTVTGYDADGRQTSQSTVEVGRRLTYASIPLGNDALAAARLVVSVD